MLIRSFIIINAVSKIYDLYLNLFNFVLVVFSPSLFSITLLKFTLLVDC